MNDDEVPASTEYGEYTDGPLPNRLTGSTLLGCLGLVGVMTLPLLLFLPFEDWDLPRWAILLLQLAAFGALGGGIGLLARVPSTVRPRSSDPRRPLTARGTAPVLERPARARNRIGLAAVVGLVVLGAFGFIVAAFGGTLDGSIAVGTTLVSLSGVALAIYGCCIALRKLEPPALRWVRTPATPSWLPQGGSLMLLGLTLLAWALMIAAEARFIWGAAGLVVLLLSVLLIAPAFRRLPSWNRGDEQ
jgi:hypothetical protein